DRYSRLHQTSGTSGTTPLRWVDTPESWDWWVRLWADHVFRSAGMLPDDRVFLAFSFGPFIGFWSAFSGAERLGALVIPGGAMTTEQRLRTMLELGATVLCCTPTIAIRLAEVAQGMGIEVRDDTGAVHSLPETGTITGELVATNLGRWGSPLIRYRTGDRVELTRAACECGSPFAKMVGGIRGRVDDMFTVRGVNLYPSQV